MSVRDCPANPGPGAGEISGLGFFAECAFNTIEIHFRRMDVRRVLTVLSRELNDMRPTRLRCEFKPIKQSSAELRLYPF
jgi:hypothetical protein